MLRKYFVLLAAFLTLLLVLTATTALSEDIVLVDNDQLTIKVTGFKEDDFWGPSMKMFLENKTDHKLMFSIDRCAVNGYMNDPIWAAEVLAGSKANETISWMELTEDILRLDLEMSVTDADDWEAEPYLDTLFTVYPQGEENGVIVEREAQPSDITLFDTEDATMLITGFRQDETWGYTADVYLINKTDVPLLFSINAATVNDFMCDPFWAADVSAGMRAYSSISWSDDMLAENDITSVQKLLLYIQVYDADAWDLNYLIDEQYIINIP